MQQITHNNYIFISKHENHGVKEQAEEIVKTIVQPQLSPMPFIPKNHQMRVALTFQKNQNAKDENTKIENSNDKFSAYMTISKNRGIIKANNEFLFDITTNHLYSRINITSHKLNVLFSAFVLNDGFGDYYNACEAAEHTKRNWPNLEISILLCHAEIDLEQLVRKPIDGVNTIFLPFYNFSRMTSKDTPIYKEKIRDTFSAAKIQIQNSDLIIEISQSIYGSSPFYIELYNSLNKKEYIYINEYGGIYENQENHTMGLSNNSLGIFIKSRPEAPSLIHLKDKELLYILTGKHLPDDADLEYYLTSHEPVFGYLKWDSYCQLAFIYTAISTLRSSEKSIDIIIPPTKLACLDIEFLKLQNIGIIIEIKKEDGNWTENKIKISETGKVLRLINPFPLEQCDFQILTAYTNNLVGCKGDQSFSEVISFDRIPFYQIFSYKKIFYSSILELSSYVDTENCIKNYFESLLKISDLSFFKENESVNINIQKEIIDLSVTIAEILQKPEFHNSMKLLNEIIRTQYSFNQSLDDIINHKIMLNVFPALKEEKDKIFEEYKNNKLSLQKAQLVLNIKLDQLISQMDNPSSSPK